MNDNFLTMETMDTYLSNLFIIIIVRAEKPRDIEIMIRMYLIQYWFQLSDEATEEAIIDSNSMRRFVGIDFFDNQVPDSTTLLRFRHTLENNNLHLIIIANFEECLRNHQYFFKHGNITDASIIRN